MAPGIIEIGSTSAFDTLVKSMPPTQLLVMDFHATWCGPCHAIAPVFAKLASQYPHAKFVKVDVDAQAELAQRFRISAMPTFKLLKAGREVAEIRGANPPQLQQLVKYHAGDAPKPGAASASASTPTAAPEAAEGSLLPHVLATGISCLNESRDHPLSTIVGPNAGPKGRSYLESDTDAELLIGIKFNSAVKIKHLSIFGGVSPSQAPKTIKLYVNQNNMDFSNTEQTKPDQEIVLRPEDVKGDRIELRYVRFQNVRDLHIFVADNQEDEEQTRIDSLDIFGVLA